MIQIYFILGMLFRSFIPVEDQERVVVRDGEVSEYLQLADRSIYKEPSKAVAYANAAILGAGRSGDSALLIRAYVALGRSYVNLGSIDLGYDAYTKAKDICPADSLQLQAYIDVNIGNLFSTLGEIHRAFRFIDEAVEAYARTGDSVGMANCYNARGLGYEKLGEAARAEACFREALALNRRLGDRRGMAKNLNNIGLLKGSPEEKITCLQEAVQINRQLGADWALTENYNNLGAQYFYKKEYEKALEWLQMAFRMAGKLSARELICDNYRYSTWVYNDMKAYDKAYECLYNLYELEKTILSEKRIREIELNTVDRRFREQQRELNLKQKELKIRNLQQDMLLVIIIAVVLLACLLLIFWRSRYKKKVQIAENNRETGKLQQEMIRLELARSEEEKKNMELELRHNKHELINLACYINSKNELIGKIKDMIRDSYQNARPEVKAQLKTINAFIAQYQHKDNSVSQLIQEIEKINAEFMERLSVVHPNLTKNEKQLASLLRIDFSTKEIALLIGSASKTVNMARYRLRKKIGLDTDEGLSEYMKTI